MFFISSNPILAYILQVFCGYTGQLQINVFFFLVWTGSIRLTFKCPHKKKLYRVTSGEIGGHKTQSTNTFTKNSVQGLHGMLGGTHNYRILLEL
jgi:hypothetical protein